MCTLESYWAHLQVVLGGLGGEAPLEKNGGKLHMFWIKMLKTQTMVFFLKKPTECFFPFLTAGISVFPAKIVKCEVWNPTEQQTENPTKHLESEIHIYPNFSFSRGLPFVLWRGKSCAEVKYDFMGLKKFLRTQCNLTHVYTKCRHQTQWVQIVLTLPGNCLKTNILRYFVKDSKNTPKNGDKRGGWQSLHASTSSLFLDSLSLKRLALSLSTKLLEVMQT